MNAVKKESQKMTGALSCSCSKELQKKIEKFAKNDMRSPAWVVRTILEKHVDEFIRSQVMENSR